MSWDAKTGSCPVVARCLWVCEPDAVMNLTSSATSAPACPVSPSVFQEGSNVPGNTCQQYYIYSCSVAKSCPTLCDPMDCSTPGFPVLHSLSEFAYVHVHWIRWCHPTISSYVVPFFSCLQSFSASESFPASRLFASGAQSIGPSTSASVLSIQSWFPVGLIGLTSLLYKGLSRVFSNTAVQKHEFFSAQPSLWSNSHISTWLKIIALTIRTFVSKVISPLFNTLSMFVIAFLPRSKHLLILLLQSLSTVILEPHILCSNYYFLPLHS